MSKIQDYINNFTFQSFEVEDIANSVADFNESRMEGFRAIAQAVTLTMEDGYTRNDIIQQVESETGIDITNRSITLQNGEIIQSTDLIDELIWIRDTDYADDSTVEARSGNSIPVSDIVREMSNMNYNSEAFSSSLRALAGTDASSDSANINNSFINILNTVNSSIGGIFDGIKNIYSNILMNKNLTKRDKLYAILDQFSGLSASYDNSTKKVTFVNPSYSNYTGISPIAAWMSSIDVNINWLDFPLLYPKILSLQISSCLKISTGIAKVAVKLAKWTAETFITGKNFKKNSGFTNRYIDIPVKTGTITISNLINSTAEVTPGNPVTVSWSLLNAINKRVDRSDGSPFIGADTIADILKSMIPLYGSGYLIVPHQTCYMVMYRDSSDYIHYQVFTKPTSTHTKYGDNVQLTGSQSGTVTTLNYPIKDLYDTYCNDSFSELEIDDDNTAGEAIRASLYRTNLWTLMLALDPTIFGPNTQPEWWNSYSTPTAYYQAVLPYVGGNISNGSGEYYTGYLYSSTGLSSNNPLGNVPAFPTNLELVNIITNNLSNVTSTDDRFLATIMKNLILNNSYIINRYSFKENAEPIFIPYYIGNAMSLNFKYTVATDSSNAKVFSNFLVKSAIIGAVVGLGIAYVKIKLWGTGLVATWSARYTSDLVKLSQLSLDNPTYNYWFNKTVKDRKRLQWVSLLGSIIGGSAGVPDVLDRTTSTIVDLGTTSNKDVINEIKIVNSNIIG